MITFDMAAYFTSLLIYNNYNFEKQSSKERNRKKKSTKEKQKNWRVFKEIKKFSYMLNPKRPS